MNLSSYENFKTGVSFPGPVTPVAPAFAGRGQQSSLPPLPLSADPPPGSRHIVISYTPCNSPVPEPLIIITKPPSYFLKLTVKENVAIFVRLLVNLPQSGGLVVLHPVVAHQEGEPLGRLAGGVDGDRVREV